MEGKVHVGDGFQVYVLLFTLSGDVYVCVCARERERENAPLKLLSMKKVLLLSRSIGQLALP